MSASNDPDYNFKKAILLMHSTSPTSATDIRLMLDELIKQRYGPSKMLVNTLSKKQLDWELTAPGIVTQPEPGADEVINLTNSPAKTISDSPDTIADSDDGAMLTMATSEEVENLKEFGDLNCCVCGEMMFTATNRLIECSQCGSLYHQECHKPAITNEETTEDQEHNWQCNNCNDKPSTSRAAAAAAAAATSAAATSSTAAAAIAMVDEPMPLVSKPKSSASSSRSSSSSNSSSPFYKQEHSSSSSGKHQKSSSSSSKSNKEERSRTKASAITTPATNVISGVEKSSSSSSKKSSSSHSSSSKSSSSKSSSSKHHDSSSGSGSKRKLSK